jgi:hypothetical protein
MNVIPYVIAIVGLVSFTANPVRADNAPPAAPAATAPPASGDELPGGGVEIIKAVLAKNVVDREPADEITEAKVGDVVVGWTQVRSGVGETTVTHRWLKGEDNMGDVPLQIKGSPWRTWSRKTVSEPGSWKWQVLDPKGGVLKEVAFQVTEGAPAASAPSAAPAAAPAAPGAAH